MCVCVCVCVVCVWWMTGVTITVAAMGSEQVSEGLVGICDACKRSGNNRETSTIITRVHGPLVVVFADARFGGCSSKYARIGGVLRGGGTLEIGVHVREFRHFGGKRFLTSERCPVCYRLQRNVYDVK